MAAANGIQWKRVLWGGFLNELALFAIVLPLNMISQQATYYSVPVLVFVSAILFAYWAARTVQNRFVLHGALVAIVASAIYITLTTALAAPVPLLFHLSHGLRLLGGALGGKLAERRLKTPLAARAFS
jgi:putative membrane protein (TIGR04086 family)